MNTITKMRCGSICTTILNAGRTDKHGQYITAELTRTTCTGYTLNIRNIIEPHNDTARIQEIKSAFSNAGEHSKNHKGKRIKSQSKRSLYEIKSSTKKDEAGG